MKSITRDAGWLELAPTVSHEIGHLRGLVDTMLWGADRHNSKPLIRGERSMYTRTYFISLRMELSLLALLLIQLCDPVEITAVPWRLVGDSLSWFHSDTDGGLVTGYVSNLVHHARVAVDYDAFYATVRDGANVPRSESRWIFSDSLNQLLYWGIYESDTYANKILDDVRITGDARKRLDHYLRHRRE